MEKVIIEHKEYWTNITDPKKLNKCKNFYENGCNSYAISFNNTEDSYICSTTLKGMTVIFLRDANFNQYFIPVIVKDKTTSEQILKKGIDLIEIV